MYSLLPGLGSGIIYVYVVKSSALLKVRSLEKSFILFNDDVIVFCWTFQAVYELDKDAMLEVMEQVSNQHDSIQKTNLSKTCKPTCQTEGSRLLGEMLKEKLLSRVEVSLDNPKSELYTIFSNIDDQGRSNLRYRTQPHRSILPACRRYIFLCVHQ